jgi:hypothetical protein
LRFDVEFNEFNDELEEVVAKLGLELLLLFTIEAIKL